jgi:hypothetical protein
VVVLTGLRWRCVRVGHGFGGFSRPTWEDLLSWNTVGVVLPLQAEFFLLIWRRVCICKHIWFSPLSFGLFRAHSCMKSDLPSGPSECYLDYKLVICLCSSVEGTLHLTWSLWWYRWWWWCFCFCWRIHPSISWSLMLWCMNEDLTRLLMLDLKSSCPRSHASIVLIFMGPWPVWSDSVAYWLSRLWLLCDSQCSCSWDLLSLPLWYDDSFSFFYTLSRASHSIVWMRRSVFQWWRYGLQRPFQKHAARKF